MPVQSSSEIRNKKFDGIQLPPPYYGFLGLIEPSASILLWGPKGSGKTTFAVAFADVLAGTVGKGLFVSGEEGIGLSFANKLKRLDVNNADLLISDYHGVDGIKEDALKNKVHFIFLDSLFVINHSPKIFHELQEWSKDHGIMLIVIAHARKDNKYKGDSSIAHMVDTEITIQDGVAQTVKNRFAELSDMEVAFNKHRSRTNPVPVPFTITLEKLNKLHSIHSWRRLNSFVGFAFPCFTHRDHTAYDQGKRAHISFRYSPNYKKKDYVLELLLDEKVEYQACSHQGFKACWKQILNKYSDLQIEIDRQDHARKVLGAKEYHRQERQQQKTKTSTRKRSSKPAGKSTGKTTPKKTARKTKPKTKAKTPPDLSAVDKKMDKLETLLTNALS